MVELSQLIIRCNLVIKFQFLLQIKKLLKKSGSALSEQAGQNLLSINILAGRRKWKHYLQKKELGVRKKHIDILLEKLGISDEHYLFSSIGKGELDIDYVFNILEEIIEKGKKICKQ